MTTKPGENAQPPIHRRGLLRYFADLHNLVFQSDYRIVPAMTRPVPQRRQIPGSSTPT